MDKTSGRKEEDRSETVLMSDHKAAIFQPSRVCFCSLGQGDAELCVPQLRATYDKHTHTMFAFTLQLKALSDEVRYQLS